jgi:hypothetical protein
MLRACYAVAAHAEMAKEWGKGLPWVLLCGIASQLRPTQHNIKFSDIDDEQAYVRIGKTVMEELRRAFKNDKKLHLFQLIADLRQEQRQLSRISKYIALYDNHSWVALACEFVVRQLCYRSTMAGVNDEVWTAAFGDVLNHVVQRRLQPGKHRADDLELDMSRTYPRKVMTLAPFRFVTYVVEWQLTQKLSNILKGKLPVAREDLGKIGRVVVQSAWDIYDQKQGSIKEETEEIRLRALQIVLDVAFQRNLSTDSDKLTEETKSNSFTVINQSFYRLCQANPALLKKLGNRYKREFDLDYVNVRIQAHKIGELQMSCRGPESHVDDAGNEFKSNSLQSFSESDDEWNNTAF